MSENTKENEAGAAMGVATDTGAATGSGAESTRRYSAEQVVLVECEHVREMKGETEEVVRRTRSVAAENAVLNAVRAGGVEPDWFCEWWLDWDAKLVACAVFEDVEKVGGFRKELQEYAEKMTARGEECPVRIRADDKLAKSVAAHFSAEWEKRRTEQMGKYEKVFADAVKSGKWEKRILVGKYSAKDADAKKAFGDLCSALNEANPKDVNGDGGIVYSGYWDKGNVARFCFGFPTVDAWRSGQNALDGIDADFRDPVFIGEAKGVELEMAALVIAKMQGEERAKAEREKLEKELGAKMSAAVEEGFERSGKQRNAAELID